MKSWLRWTIGMGTSALILAGLAAAIYRSYGPGDYAERVDRLQRRWSPFVGPDAPVIWRFLGQGLLVTLEIAGISILLSLVFGTLLALLRLGRDRRIGPNLPRGLLAVVSAPATVLVQIVRAAPLYMLILYTFIAAPQLGLRVEAKTSGIIALTLYTSCVLAEIIRAGILSLDRGQFEASLALGLSYVDRLRLVILPQGLRRMVPSVVSQLVTLIKDTSLLSFITVLEVNRRVVILSQQNVNPIESFLVAALIFFCVNFTLSSLAARLELKPGRRDSAVLAIQSVGAEDQVRVVEKP